MAEPMKPLDNLGEHIEERLAVGVIDIDILEGISPGGDMINGPRELNTQRSGHEIIIPLLMCACKT